jgi:hypothetical protein
MGFDLLFARHGERHRGVSAKSQPLFLAGKPVFKVPELRAAGVDLHVQTLLIAELVGFLTRFCASYGRVG